MPSRLQLRRHLDRLLASCGVEHRSSWPAPARRRPRRSLLQFADRAQAPAARSSASSSSDCQSARRIVRRRAMADQPPRGFDIGRQLVRAAQLRSAARCRLACDKLQQRPAGFERRDVARRFRSSDLAVAFVQLRCRSSLRQQHWPRPLRIEHLQQRKLLGRQRPLVFQPGQQSLLAIAGGDVDRFQLVAIACRRRSPRFEPAPPRPRRLRACGWPAALRGAPRPTGRSASARIASRVLVAVPPQNAHGQGAKRRVVVLAVARRQRSRASPPMRSSTHRARAPIVRLGVRQQRLQRRRRSPAPSASSRSRARNCVARFGLFSPSIASAMLAYGPGFSRRASFLALRRQQEDAALVGIVVGVAADAAVVPVGDVQAGRPARRRCRRGGSNCRPRCSGTLRSWPSCRSRPARAR